MYEAKFNRPIARRTLQRKLHNYNIKYTDDARISDQQVLEAVRTENALGVVGYRRLRHNLRTKYRLPVTQDRLVNLIRREGLPTGRDPKLGRKLHVKPFVSKGPNYLWSVDGHEKAAQPFGLYIYGILDTFSRKVLALHILPDKKSATVSNWLLGQICVIGGKPNRIMIDKGTEWNEVRDALNVVQMDSVFNQKIEAFWGQMLRLSDIDWYRQTLKDLERNEHFSRHDEIDRWVVWRVFAGLLQHSLNEYRESHNTYVIRKQKHLDLPSGFSPNHMYTQYDALNVENYLEPVPRKDLCSPVNVNDKYALPADLDRIIPTKDNCVEHYTNIRRFLKQ